MPVLDFKASCCQSPRMMVCSGDGPALPEPVCESRSPRLRLTLFSIRVARAFARVGVCGCVRMRLKDTLDDFGRRSHARVGVCGCVRMRLMDTLDDAPSEPGHGAARLIYFGRRPHARVGVCGSVRMFADVQGLCRFPHTCRAGRVRACTVCTRTRRKRQNT